MSEANGGEIEEIVCKYTSDERRRGEIHGMLDRQGAFREKNGQDPKELYRQLGKRLLQIQDENVLKNRALALGVVRARPILNDESCSGPPGYV